MPAIFARNWFYVAPGQPAFDVQSNICGSFQIGDPTGDDLWLQGDIVGEPGEHIFNGHLFHENGEGGIVIDNFPKSVPDGWTRVPSMHGEGYDLVDDQGEIIFGYRVEDQICRVTVNLYRSDGTLAAHGGQGGLVLHAIGVSFGPSGATVSA